MAAPAKFAKAIAKAAEQAPDVALPPAIVPGRVLHIDGDYLSYACGGSGGMPFGMCWRNLVERANAMRLFAGAQRVVLHFTDGRDKGGREWLAETQPYQGNRKAGAKKPPQWAAIRGHARSLPKPASKEQLTAIWVDDREADDSLSFVAARQRKDADGNLLDVICSRDKDLRMNPGLHLHWESQSLVTVGPDDFEVVGPEGKIYGPKWFYLQMLMGDTVDHIPGLGFKTGEVTATKILKDIKHEADAIITVLDLYREKHGNDPGVRRFIEQATLLWMRQDKTARPDNYFATRGILGKESAIYIREKRNAYEAQCREAEAAA